MDQRDEAHGRDLLTRRLRFKSEWIVAGRRFTVADTRHPGLAGGGVVPGRPGAKPERSKPTARSGGQRGAAQSRLGWGCPARPPAPPRRFALRWDR